jgi:hypothetical protein
MSTAILTTAATAVWLALCVVLGRREWRRRYIKAIFSANLGSFLPDGGRNWLVTEIKADITPAVWSFTVIGRNCTTIDRAAVDTVLMSIKL